jgi:hypothetical protein
VKKRSFPKVGRICGEAIPLGQSGKLILKKYFFEE